jgi:hypothetical protein
VKEDPRWALWVLVVVALGILSIAVQEYREDNPGEAFYLGSAWLDRGRSRSLDVVAEKEDFLNKSNR